MPWFDLALFVVAVLAGATAAVSGFGIGSLLTPLLAVEVGMSAAVAAVALPHAVATAVRCWRLRRGIDWPVLRRFGVPSAIGGLAGAWLYAGLENRVLTAMLGALLVLTAIAGLTGWVERLHPRGRVVQALGLLSGFFGGVAGNQGGIRSGALLAFGLTPVALVATATATGLLVDAARTPIYLVSTGAALVPLAWPIAIATAGVLVGTFAGERLLFGLPPARFRRVVSSLIGAIGVWLVARAM